MIPLHSTHLKKIYSNNLETNAVMPVNLIASEVLQPTIEMQPTVMVKTIDNMITGTFFTTPTDKNCYVTKIMLTGVDLSSPNEASVTLPTYENGDQKINHVASGAPCSAQIDFGNKGILLRKGANITTTNGLTICCLTMVYYLGSDRA